MLSKNFLREVVLDQEKNLRLPANYVPRDIEAKLLSDKSKHIVIISGLRRVGKSTLLLKIKEKQGGHYYLNFDDERLSEFSVKDFQILWEVFLELYGEEDYFYFDEIQNIKDWERFVRRLYDYGKKIYLTGSNARLLSPELGTHLTGRYLQYELFPFSLVEFLRFKGIKFNLKKLDTTEKIKLLGLFKDYLANGGIPEFLLNNNQDILKLLYENILYRDIAARFEITNVSALRELGKYILANFSTEVSFNRLKTLLGVKSHTTVANYFSYFQDAYLAFLVPQFHYSVRKQTLSPKKLYTIDTGLSRIAGFNFSQNLGKALENLVFLELKKSGYDIYYFKDGGKECDFVIRKGFKVKRAFQVVAEINPQNQEREIQGLLTALEKFKLSRGAIITLEQEGEKHIGNKTIKIVPVYKWILNKAKI